MSAVMGTRPEQELTLDELRIAPPSKLNKSLCALPHSVIAHYGTFCDGEADNVLATLTEKFDTITM